MGSNHARVIAESDAADLAVIIDPDSDRVAPLAARLGCAYAPGMEAASRCDAAIIATPTSLHVQQTLQLLRAGIPLLVEKPLAADLDDTRAIIDCAACGSLPMMCVFGERFYH